MAIEIPGIAADRLSHPDWGPAPALDRYVVPAGRLLAALETAATPAVVLDGLRRLAAAGGSVPTLLAPDRGLVQILLDGRRIPLTGAARDAVLTLLGDTARPAGAGALPPAAAGAAPDAFLAARVAAVDAQVQEARAHVGETPAAAGGTPEPVAAAVIAEPLLRGADVQATAAALERAVGQSGLFLEAHVAQWLRGDRTLGQVQAETRALVAGDPALADPQERAGRQLDALQRQQIPLDVQAWPGQPMQLEIACDPDQTHGADPADAPALFQATLSLQLPSLGLLRARIRVLHDTVGLQIVADRSERVQPGLAELADALAAHGLHLAALALAPATEQPT